jgi:hypothetical protein
MISWAFISLSFANLFSQPALYLGINLGGVFPLGEVHTTHQFGIKFGFSELLLIRPPFFSLAAGQEISLIYSSSENYPWYSSSFADDIDYFSIFAGSRFGNKTGPFALSTVILSLPTTETWVGCGVGLGYAFSSRGLSHTIEIAVKVRWMNTIKHEERESNLVVAECNFNFYFK